MQTVPLSIPILHLSDNMESGILPSVLKDKDIVLPWWPLMGFAIHMGYTYAEAKCFFQELQLPIDKQVFNMYKDVLISESLATEIEVNFEDIRYVRLGSDINGDKKRFYDTVALIVAGISTDRALSLLLKIYGYDRGLCLIYMHLLWDERYTDLFLKSEFMPWLQYHQNDLWAVIDKARSIDYGRKGVLTLLGVQHNEGWKLDHIIKVTFEQMELARDEGDSSHSGALQKQLYKFIDLREDYRKRQESVGSDSEMAGVLRQLKELSGEGCELSEY